MKKRTFIVEINDTQSHSWQGNIEWVQEGRKQSFRSVMEMLRLMDSAIGEQEPDWRAPGKQEENGGVQSGREKAGEARSIPGADIEIRSVQEADEEGQREQGSGGRDSGGQTERAER